MAAETAVLTSEQLDQLRRFAPSHYKLVRKMQRQSRRAGPQSPPEVAAPAGPELVIDLSNYMERLTVGDMEDMERASGISALNIAWLGSGGLNVAGTAALIWVLRRKEDPDYTYQQARELPASLFYELMSAFAPKGSIAPAEAEEAGDENAPLDDSALPSA